MLLEQLVRDQAGRQQHAQRHQDHIVEVAEHRDEIRDQVDRAHRIERDQQGRRLGIPRHPRIPRRQIDRIDVAPQVLRPAAHPRAERAAGEHAPDVEHHDQADDRLGEEVDIAPTTLVLGFQQVARCGQRRGPCQRADRGVEQERQQRHARHAGRQRDQRAHSRHQAADQHRDPAVALEPAHRLADLLLAEREPTAVAGGEGADPLLAEPHAGIVPGQGAEHRAERAGQHHQHRIELAPRGDEARERHDQLRGDRRKNVLGEHHQRDADIAALRDRFGDPVEHVLPRGGDPLPQGARSAETFIMALTPFSAVERLTFAALARPAPAAHDALPPLRHLGLGAVDQLARPRMLVAKALQQVVRPGACLARISRPITMNRKPCRNGRNRPSTPSTRKSVADDLESDGLHALPASSRHSSSLSVVTPSSAARLALEPASAPTTT